MRIFLNIIRVILTTVLEVRAVSVGRIVHTFNDYSRKELFSDDETRAIIVSVFYPAILKNIQEIESNYLNLFDPCADDALSVLKNMGVDEDYFRNIKALIHNHSKSELITDNYPVILYSPAFGVVRDMYTYHIEQLVKSGFIVVSIGSTYESIFSIFPEGRWIKQADELSEINSTDFQLWAKLLEARVDDILYVMDHLDEIQPYFASKQINCRAMGIVGHSLGGAAAFEAAKRDRRIKAGVMLDPSFHLLSFRGNVKLDTPFLIMRQEKCSYDELRDELSEGIIHPFLHGFEKLHTVLTGYRSFVNVSGAHHMTFSDVPIHYKDSEISEKHNLISKYGTRFLCEFIQDQACAYQNLLDNNQLNGIVEIDQKGDQVCS